MKTTAHPTMILHREDWRGAEYQYGGWQSKHSQHLPSPKVSGRRQLEASGGDPQGSVWILWPLFVQLNKSI